MTSAQSPLLLTLGYSKRSIDEVIELLEQHRVRFLADVRSVPWSRHYPDFTRDTLKAHLASHEITYLFLGDELGGRPQDPSCYDEGGHVDYEACRRRPEFRDGIERLRTAWEQGQRVALLCTESKPQDCHRAKLVGPALVEEGIDVTHLDEDGALLSQQQVMERLTQGQLSLFEGLPSGKATRSRGRYHPAEE